MPADATLDPSEVKRNCFITMPTDYSPRVPLDTALCVAPGPCWLPSELWVLVMSQLVLDNRDFPGAWTNCRMVSRSFKEATETAFLCHSLPELQVQLSLAGTLGRRFPDTMPLQLLGRSEDGERVHYGPDPEDPDGERLSKSSACRRAKSVMHPNDLQRRTSSQGGTFGNPPLLIEWASKIYLSVCKGPTAYYSWSERCRAQLRCAWIQPNSDYTMDMCVDHHRHEVSFLWKPMLNIVASRFARQPSVE
jgi:hypothetical protein